MNIPLPDLLVTDRNPSTFEAMRDDGHEFRRLFVRVRRRDELVVAHYNAMTEKFYSWDDGSEVKNVAGWIPANVDSLVTHLHNIVKADRVASRR